MKDRLNPDVISPWAFVKPYLVKMTGGRFWGEFGMVVAHDGPMRIVEFGAAYLDDRRYRVHVDSVEVIGEREH